MADATQPRLQTLGDVLGSLRYFGQCPDCGSQHVSTHDRVLVRGHELVCERCARKAAL